MSIEDISVQLEEPFSVLPLEAICHRVQAGVSSLEENHAKYAQIASSAHKVEGLKKPGIARPPPRT